MLIHKEDQSPRARRDRFSAFFCAAALVHEGLRTAEGLGKCFRALPQHKSGFAVILSGPEITPLRSGDLCKIRNELVFRFDRASLETGLATTVALPLAGRIHRGSHDVLVDSARLLPSNARTSVVPTVCPTANRLAGEAWLDQPIPVPTRPIPPPRRTSL